VNVAALKTVGVFAAIGALVGNALATLTAPVYYTWYNTAGIGSTQSLCDQAVLSKQIFNQLIKAQLVGTGVGALAFVVLGILFVRWRRSRAAAPA
jgi:hypothetical protein